MQIFLVYTLLIYLMVKRVFFANSHEFRSIINRMGNIYKYNVKDERISLRFMGQFDENLIDKITVVFAQRFCQTRLYECKINWSINNYVLKAAGKSL